MELQGLWNVFGPDTTTGRQLRSLFGNPDGRNASKITYPKLRTRPVRVPSSPPQREMRTQIRYPKFAPSETNAETLPTRPSRRSALVIKQSVSPDLPSQPEFPTRTKDLSQEKRKLQDAFQFSSSRNSAITDAMKPEFLGEIKLPVIVDSRNTVAKYH